jgi:quercetin dioxygenase-like cupin family protein
MTAQPFVVSPLDRTRSLRVVGEHITVLASAAQTGSYEIFFQAGPEGSGPPLHNHPWDEAFYVLRGEVAFGVGDCESLAVAGTLVQVPGGTTHWFRYGRRGGEMLTMTSREGASARA